MDTGSGTLMLVEDDPADAEFALHVIKDTLPSVQIVAVRTGSAALEHLFPAPAGDGRQRSSIKAILLDLHLPGIDGFEVLRRVKTDPHLRSIPVIILSSSREAKDIERCYQLGANSYVVKPIDAEQYVIAVGSIVSFWFTVNETFAFHDHIPMLAPYSQ